MPKRSVHELKLIANALRQDVIREVTAGKSGHPGGSLSSADIVSALWFSGAMRYDETDGTNHSADRFFLSKGHAAPILYAAFHQLGWIADEDIPTLRQLGSKLQGHPDCHALPQLEVCSGSLGQGLSISAGVACGLKIDDAAVNDGVAADDVAGEQPVEPRRVFCLLGDGEMQEGSNWEALMFAAARGLDNLVALLDLNNLQIDGHVTDVCSLGDIDAKLAAFGWNVLRVNGHDIPALLDALAWARGNYGTGKPSVIVCETIKGRGVSYMEDQVGWHGKAPSQELADTALAELAAERAALEKEAN